MKRLTFLLMLLIFAEMLPAGNISEIPAIIPKPAHLKPGKGIFNLNDNTGLYYEEGDSIALRTARMFASWIQLAGGPVLTTTPLCKEMKKENRIIFITIPGKKEKPESYLLEITTKTVGIAGQDEAGLFYGMQTLLQLLPVEIYSGKKLEPGRSWAIPAVEIRDTPRFPYRGMHLDVSRHFFPKEFVMKYIDLLASYKMNVFHWHLTDDNGWRIEIKKYPKLTSVGAWHVDHEDLPWGERPAQQPGEKATYGGFYTQNDIREVVAYAKERFVTVIPEIEMPAHSIEVLAAYPQFSCTGGPFTVPPGSYWPNTDILCAGNDSVFTFLQDVLDEVIPLFPSPYIHLGGDEADKTRWKECPKCQARVKAEGLKDEKELQSYFMKRMEKYLVSKGKKMIGWDEILEGGLAPEATVMSWRGLEGGIAAATMGHDVIMTPTSFCYFDYYQGDPAVEPKAIGGFVTLKKVFSFEPVPAELNKEQEKHILGAQGNLWTEFIPTSSHAEYMAVPRMIALAETDWTPKDLKDWADFRNRLESHFPRLEKRGINYSKGSYKVEISTSFDPVKSALMIRLESEQPKAVIRYSLNGDDPDSASPAYSAPISMAKNGYLKAGIFENGKPVGAFAERSIIFHKGIGKKISYLEPYSYRYTAGGDEGLADGLRGTVNFREGNWQGYLGNDLEVIIDLGSIQPVRSVSVTFLQSYKSWIFMPDSVIFSLSADGKRYHSINDYGNETPVKTDKTLIKEVSHLYPDTKARYVRVRAKNRGVCPQGHEGAGEKCWLFADEIVIF